MLKFLKVSQEKLEGRQADWGPVQAELMQNWSVLQSISCSKVTKTVCSELSALGRRTAVSLNLFYCCLMLFISYLQWLETQLPELPWCSVNYCNWVIYLNLLVDQPYGLKSSFSVVVGTKQSSQGFSVLLLKQTAVSDTWVAGVFCKFHQPTKYLCKSEQLSQLRIWDGALDHLGFLLWRSQDADLSSSHLRCI